MLLWGSWLSSRFWPRRNLGIGRTRRCSKEAGYRAGPRSFLRRTSKRLSGISRIYRAEHPHQLIRRDGVIFNVDQVVAGVGCTAIKNLEPYRPVPQTYEFTIYFKPFQGGAAAAREIYRSLTP